MHTKIGLPAHLIPDKSFFILFLQQLFILQMIQIQHRMILKSDAGIILSKMGIKRLTENKQFVQESMPLLQDDHLTGTHPFGHHLQIDQIRLLLFQQRISLPQQPLKHRQRLRIASRELADLNIDEAPAHLR